MSTSTQPEIASEFTGRAIAPGFPQEGGPFPAGPIIESDDDTLTASRIINTQTARLDIDKMLMQERLTGEIRKESLRLEGVVLEVADGEFECRVSDVLYPNNPEEILTLGFEDLLETDYELVQPGAIFSWTMGRTLRQKGQPSNERYSRINFRRIVPWSQGELERARKEAAKFASTA